MYRKKGRGWTKHVDFMLLDIVCIIIAFFISYVIRFGFDNPYVDKDYRTLGVAFLLIDFFVEIMADSFKNVLKRGYLDEFISVCKHAVLVFLVTALFLFTTQMADIYSRLSFYIMFPIYVTITYVCRLALKSFLKKKDFTASKKSLLVIAPEAMLRDTLRTVEKGCMGYTQIVAASLDSDLKGKTIYKIPVVANHDGIADYACDEWVDEVLIPPCSEKEYPDKLAAMFLEMGIAVHTGIAKNGTDKGGYKQIEKIGDYTVVTSSVNYANTSALLVKRGMDIVGGLVGCLFTLIIMIFVGPMIYIASPGPIFFAQERVGRNGRKFKMYKFRSMYMDAEERKKELMAENKIGDGMMFKMDFDPRIIGNKVLPNGKKKTGIGQFIRKTSLDEFPQFWNIFRGDMSLVGTRPPTLDEWEKYEPHHRARMSFRPGLTGLWQVSGRSNITDFEEVVKLDTKYISEWSVINNDAGSTHIEGLQKFVVDNGIDVGFAYDGDADRCLCVDELGNVITGDHILYIYGRYMKDRDKLLTNTVVTTIMSNFGLYKAFDELGIGYAKTAVGDKYVYEYMQQNGCRIGGEQSGHIIFSKYASTGDGILTSLKMMEVMLARKQKLSELCDGLTIYPQVLENVRVADKAEALANPDVQAAIEQVTAELGDTGRILVRESGTEPVIRVMVEAESEDICRKYVDMVVQKLK